MSYARWMLTINNPIGDFATYFKVDEHLKFAAWQLEIAPTTETRHLQCYLELKQRLVKRTVIDLYPGAHVERCHGNQQSCITYVTKEESRAEGPWSIGNRARPGTRNDIIAIRDKVIAKVSYKELIMDNELLPAFSRTQKFVAFMKLELAEDRDFQTKIIVLWGTTGIGKSRLARALLPQAWYYSNTHGVWFDGYDGTSSIIFDDFYGNIPYKQWLQLTDRYPVRVESKGGMINFAPKVIIFTSNRPPWEWWKESNGEWKEFGPIERRIHECYTHPLPDTSSLQIN